jgi:hypothetical protein
LLIRDPNDAGELTGRLTAWHARSVVYQDAVMILANRLRQHSWNDMAANIVELVESTI